MSFKKVEQSFHKVWSWVGLNASSEKSSENGLRRGLKRSLKKSEDQMKIIRKGPAMRVIFFYPGEEGTYVDHADVTLYENGIVHINSNQEETTTHLQNCEILWRFETDAEDRISKVRLLKPKSEAEAKAENKTTKISTPKNPEIFE